MTCEICGEEFGHLYAADGIADMFGEIPLYGDDEWCICSNCLNDIGERVSEAWRSRREGEEAPGNGAGAE